MILDLPLIAQEQPWWCWAASVQMLLKYLHRADASYALPQQCDIVSHGNQNKRELECCVPANWHKSDCQFGDAGSVLDFYQLAYTPVADVTSFQFEDLKAQIDAGHPVLFEWPFASSGNHFGNHWMVAIGYDTKGGTDYVYVNNPSPRGAGSSNWITFGCFSGSCTTIYQDLALKPSGTLIAARLVDTSPLGAPPFLANPIAKANDAAHAIMTNALELAGAGDRVGAQLDLAVVVYEMEFARIVDGSLTAYFDRLGKPSVPGAEPPRPRHIIYPVTLGSTMLTAFEVVPDDSQSDDPTWNECCLGETMLYDRLDLARRLQAQLWRLPLNCYFAMTSSDLGLWFVAIQDAGAIEVTPIQDVPGSTLKAGQRQSLAMVASALQQLATPIP